MTKAPNKLVGRQEEPRAPEQLLLALQTEPGVDFATFVVGDNSEVLAQLQE